MKKSIPISSLKAEIERLSDLISGLEAEKRVLQRMIAPNESPENSKTKRIRRGSKFRQALDVLSQYSATGLTIKELVEKAKEKGIELQTTTIASQFSKAIKEGSSEIFRLDDGKYSTLPF